MEQEAAEGAGLTETDRAFHATLRRGPDDVPPSEVLEAFRDAVHRVQRDPVDVPRDQRADCRRHREILDTVRSGDSPRVEEASRDHFDTVRTRLSTTGAPQPPESHPRHNERV
jgi:DNA-binding FadR family transcriptional regulator